jgi:hypothetical protein
MRADPDSLPDASSPERACHQSLIVEMRSDKLADTFDGLSALG